MATKNVIKLDIKQKKKGDGKMSGTMVKPIEATTIISEKKYVKEILDSISKKPCDSAMERNRRSLELLKRARRG